MQRILAFLRALARHPKTTAAGIASLVGLGFAGYSNPRILAEPATWVAILTAIGLLLAADSSGRGGNDQQGPKPPAVAVEQPRPKREVIEMPSASGLLCA